MPPNENGWQGGPPETRSTPGPKGAKFHIAAIALAKRPSRDGGGTGRLVIANRVAGVSVPIDNEFVFESCLLDAHSEPARAYE